VPAASNSSPECAHRLDSEVDSTVTSRPMALPIFTALQNSTQAGGRQTSGWMPSTHMPPNPWQGLSAGGKVPSVC
jgi:hypothetical protein